MTIDYLPDLTASEMSSAGTLKFEPYSAAGVSWDNHAVVFGSEKYAILHSIYRFSATEGATYDITSVSFLDPFLLRIYDQNGNTIVANDEKDDLPITTTATYQTDMILDWVAPSTGTYYVDASWNQGTSNTNYFLFVDEDIDTIDETSAIDSDRVFNWAESVYSHLFPNHPDSQDVFGYHARIYSTGDGLGEKDGNIYYYDGGDDGTGEVSLVGSTSDFLVQAAAAGF